MEILNLRKTANGYLINGLVETVKDDANYQNALDWEADGKEVMPEYTIDELDAQALDAKWAEYALYCSTLTVTAASGNKFAADQETLTNVAFKRDAITDATQVLWVESWDTFTTGKVELQEVFSEADRLMQLKIVELFEVV